MVEVPKEKETHLYNPKKLPTEELIANIVGDQNHIEGGHEIRCPVTDFLRSKLQQEISVEDLTQLEGVGEAKALQILSAIELGRRFHLTTMTKNNAHGDWDFADLKQSDRQYGVHFFHHYTAKFIPQIPSRLIRRLANPSDIIVDPFMGSGTTLVEAKLLGNPSYGLDTNPLAVKIAKAKTMDLNIKRVREIDDFIHWLKDKKTTPEKETKRIEEVILFPGSQVWFRPDVAFKFKDILEKIAPYSSDIQNFLEIGLSTLLKGMSNARMDSVVPVLPENPVYIDRKHYYREVNNNTRKILVYKRLYSQITRMKNALLEFNKEIDNQLVCRPILGDARDLSQYVDRCGLVITSPPYWSAINYQKVHKLSFMLFNLETEDGKEIGRDSSNYMHDMRVSFSQIAEILHGYFALVIGEDRKKNSHEKLLCVAQEIGLILLKQYQEELATRSRGRNRSNVSLSIYLGYRYICG